MSIDVTITDNSKEILTAEQEAVRTALEAIGIKVEYYAKKSCPVYTGLLRNSITYAVSGEKPAIDSYEANPPKKKKAKAKKGKDEEQKEKEEVKKGEYNGTVGMRGEAAVYIGTNVEYAIKVEYNDRVKHTSGKAHFLRDAVTTHSNLYKNIAKKALEGTTQ